MKTNEAVSALVLAAALTGCTERPIIEPQPAAATCADGAAGEFACEGVELLAFVRVADLGGGAGAVLNDVWGWTDPETGREYALVGRTDGTAFVDVTDPTVPRGLGDLPKTAGTAATTWRDIKVYDDHAFIVADGTAGHGMQVFDLRRLRGVETAVTFEPDAIYDRFGSAHNLAIDTVAGLAAAVGAGGGGDTCGGGLHLIDIRDPLNPAFAGCFLDANTALGSGYTHDAQCVTYAGPDTRFTGRRICLGANVDALSIADVTDPANPVALAAATYPAAGYLHQGWLTEDQRHFYMDDELDEFSADDPRTRTLVWDVAELDDPVLVAEHLGVATTTDHNLYVRGDTMYQANYASGLRVLDISDRENPVEIGYFDTVPGTQSPGFVGAWSVYPFFASGTILVSSIHEGLFVLRVAPPSS